MDPFLAAHCVVPLRTKEGIVFTASGGIAPFTIRDQILRATWLIERALAEGFLVDVQQAARDGKPPSGVIIKGAGVAGLAATLRAIELKVPVILLEHRSPVWLQAGSNRYLHPNQYDWPASHWENPRFPPVDDSRVPLPWKAGTSSDIAAGWLQIFAAAKARPGNDALLHEAFDPEKFREWGSALDVWWKRNDELGQKAEHPALIELKFWQEQFLEVATQRRTGYLTLIDCSGRGGEKAYLGERPFLHTPKYWMEDRLDDEHLGCAQTPSVLMSGTGDGALQDTLRIFFPRVPPHDIYSQLWADAGLQARRQKIERRLAGDCDQYNRLAMWAGDISGIIPVNRWLHRRFVEEVAAINDAEWEILGIAFERLFQPRAKVALCMRSAQFDPCLALNRFLALLTKAFDHRRARPPGELSHLTFIENHQLADVEIEGHSWQSTPGHKNWQQFFGKSLVAVLKPMGAGQTIRHDCEMVMIRHGLERNALPFALHDRPRQILPYSPLPLN